MYNSKVESQVDSSENFKKEKAAVQDAVTGNYMAVFKMGDIDRLVPVEPFDGADISAILKAVTSEAEEKERVTTNQLALNDSASDDDVIEKGIIAKQANLESVDSLKGQISLLNELREKVFSGNMRKEAEIFRLEDKNAEFILDVKQSEVKGPKLNSKPDQTDITNRGNQFVLVVTPEEGENIENIFLNNEHRVDELKSGKGFQAEMGDIRMIFLYPDKVVNRKGNLEDREPVEGEENLSDNLVISEELQKNREDKLKNKK